MVGMVVVVARAIVVARAMAVVAVVKGSNTALPRSAKEVPVTVQVPVPVKVPVPVAFSTRAEALDHQKCRQIPASP